MEARRCRDFRQGSEVAIKLPLYESHLVHDPVLLADKFRVGEYTVDVAGDVWRLAFEYLVAHAAQISFDKNKIHTLWTSNGGHLRRKVKNDALVLSVLKLTLPGYTGRALTLYRGECRFLFDRRNIGFCWSPDIEVASQFASGLNAIESGGVLLKAYAPEVAILAGPNLHSREQMQENEYTCDPNLLRDVVVLRSYPRLAQ